MLFHIRVIDMHYEFNKVGYSVPSRVRPLSVGAGSQVPPTHDTDINSVLMASATLMYSPCTNHDDVQNLFTSKPR